MIHEANKGSIGILNDFPQLLLLTKMVFLNQNLEGRNNCLLIKVTKNWNILYDCENKQWIDTPILFQHQISNLTWIIRNVQC
jgi:hypothetical protein